MASQEETTRKWIAKFCGLMDWFIGVEKVHGDNLGDASTKGLAANYLAVKLGIFDESTAADAPNFLDREPPYTSHLWQPDCFEDSSLQQRKQWRLERMTHWKRKAEEHGMFKSMPFTPEVMPDNIRRYCDCIERIIYRADGDWTMHGEVRALARQANDLAAKLGLTHPDWILAMDLHILPYWADADEIRQLPLPWGYDRPPVILRGNIMEMLTASDIASLRESSKKAESLLCREMPASFSSSRESQVFVSYAWGDESPEGRARGMLVDDLCAALGRQGVKVKRDRDELRPGELISEFMDRLADGDFILAVISDKYLRSEYCMYELFRIYRNCADQPRRFQSKVIPLILPDAKVDSPVNRLRRARYWKKQERDLRPLIEDDIEPVGTVLFRKFKLIGEFARNTSDMLEYLLDKLQPQDFERQAQEGFREVLSQICRVS